MEVKTYKTGEKFKWIEGESECVLVQVDASVVAMVCTRAWNRVDPPVKVADIHRITADEFKQICGKETYQPIS